jgi:UDP-N-acetylmuramate dehydrogenase
MNKYKINQLPKVRGIYTKNADLSKMSWLGAGGKADILFEPTDINDLADFLKNKSEDIPITVLGGGSNTLIRDGGIRGVVIKLKQINGIELVNDKLVVGCGCLNSRLFAFCRKNHIADFEFLGTIPGTVGGAIRMNAGCFGGQISDILLSANVVDLKGNISSVRAEDMGFGYRWNNVPEDVIFVEAEFKVEKGASDKIYKKFREYISRRHSSQPHGVKTAGSTFKNPEDHSAWKLIKDTDCDDLHKGKATAKDLEDLGELIRKRVFQETGIQLEWEVKRIGEF